MGPLGIGLALVSQTTRSRQAATAPSALLDMSLFVDFGVDEYQVRDLLAVLGDVTLVADFASDRFEARELPMTIFASFETPQFYSHSET